MTTEKIYIQIDDQKIEATGQVLENLLADIAENKAKEAARIFEIAAKENAKAALLERLGITADEASLLLG